MPGLTKEDAIKIFYEMNPNKEIVVLYQAGSHFFGLNGPNSDTDYRGIYIDRSQDTFFTAASGKVHHTSFKTNKIEGTKNGKDDTDFDMFSITAFFELLKKGDFNLIEALWCPEDKIIIKTPLYDELKAFRKELIHNDISAFLGFIKGEAKKVGVNTHHYTTQLDFLKILYSKHNHAKLKDFWPEVVEFANDPKNIGVKISKSKVNNSGYSIEMPAIVIAARMHQWTASAGYVIGAVEHICSQYGNRQKSTAESGADFKTLYHAMRLIYEANDILDYGELSLPFSEERFKMLWNIKYGDVDPELLVEMLNSKIDKLEVRSKTLVSNKYCYEHKLEKMIYTIKGRLEVANVIAGYKKVSVGRKQRHWVKNDSKV